MRLIDLHVDWLLQYAGESVVFDPALYPGIEQRQPQAVGYLQACRGAILSCYRRAEDWATQIDPWSALDQLITRIEAEFPGRLLIEADDFDRWQVDREGLTWGMIGVEGFDSLVTTPKDLERLPRLFDRGVRLFQPVYTSKNLLAGSSVVGDDRGLTELGLGFLEMLGSLSAVGRGPSPLFDLAHLNQPSTSDVLDWFETDPTRLQRILLIYSHGTPAHPGYDTPRAISIDNLTRLRRLGGFIGLGVSPPFFQAIDQVKQAIETTASIPFEGRVGFEGIAIGTDFLGVNQTLPGLSNAEDVIDWVQSQFERPIAKDLLHDNALGMMARATGAKSIEH
jgi:membrane dipeptidase